MGDFSNISLDREGPTREFEKEFLKTFDEKAYKKQFGEKKGKLPPSYLRKRSRGPSKKPGATSGTTLGGG